MTEKTINEEPKEKVRSYAHVFNVFLYYLRKANSVALPLYLILVFYFEKEISIDIYIAAVLLIPLGMCVVNMMNGKMDKKIGLFVRYRDLKKYNKHAFLDIVFLFCIGWLLKVMLVYILYTYENFLKNLKDLNSWFCIFVKKRGKEI